MSTARQVFRTAAVVLSLCVMTLIARVDSLGGTPLLSLDALPGLSSALGEKAVSSALIEQIQRKLSRSGAAVASARPVSAIMAAVYASEPPSTALVSMYAARGGRAFPETWTPPSQHHPLGFYLAQIPIAALADVLSLDAVKKMDTAESESVPMSNAAARAIKADLAWTMGVTGAGVKIGILDSGLDVSFAGTELPSALEKMDYSFYPQTDTIVANSAIGHGTHVAGCALGRGLLSSLNTANGGSAYKGMAPGASLAFLKIGMDGSGGAMDAAEIAAIHAAVDSFHVQVINLSYGGWDAFHDGSNILAQTVDWAYSRGVACFIAAGNYGNAARHASGFVPANDTSEYIQVNVGATAVRTLQLAFNLVWWDGTERSTLSLLYYDTNKNLLSDVKTNPTKESPRGTESQTSQYNPSIFNQAGTFYLRVVNHSSAVRQFHVYENNGAGFVQFAFPDPNFTITTPGDADHAFTVGAYSSRDSWIGANGSSGWGDGPPGSLASYSSRGPRVDGEMKPNLTAPGSMIISLRDRDVLTSTSTVFCVDDDGIAGGGVDYYVMQGTSMATPLCAGAAAILYEQSPHSSPQQIYDALMQKGTADGATGFLPNPAWGFGKLNVYGALLDLPLPVELSSFTSSLGNGAVTLSWRTATETNNYGFDVERKALLSAVGSGKGGAEDGWSRVGFIGGNGTTHAPHAYTYVDRPPSSGTYAYRLKQIDRDGRTAYSTEIEVDASALPAVFALAQNYPNPFNPATTFRFSLAAASHVRLAVFDVLGRQVAALVDKQMEPGNYAESWTAHGVTSGVYFYRLDAGAWSETKKLMVQK